MTDQQRDYRNTVLTPKTDFPMRAGLADREPIKFKQWEETGLYQKIQEKRKNSPSYILHDGPPYANGDIHLGHSLNKILKDVVVRFKTMKGFRSPYVPGWDCHGLPIEQQVSKKLGAKLNQMPAVEVRKLCHDYAMQYVGIQREQFKRLGMTGDWEKPYLTLDPTYEAGILRCLRELVAHGYVRKGRKPVHWDPVFRTALAEAEIEYEKHESDSIFVKFPVREAESNPVLKGLAKPSLVIWTTTPWTLPANVAVCLHPEFDYVALESGGEHFIVAKELAENFLKACKLEGNVVRTFKAGSIEKALCAHPIYKDRSSLVIMGRHVTLEAGTGCVHTAPGHGKDDYIVGREYGLPIVMPVDDAGKFGPEFPDMQGVSVFDANPKIIERLTGEGLLLGSFKIIHDYPHSWRSHKPVIFRATEQWFMELGEGGVRERALEAIDNAVQWIPSWGRERIVGMVSQRPDWCLSRQRSWGVPIPAIRSKKSGESILDIRVMDEVIKVVGKLGTNAWFTEPLSTFWPKDFVYEKTGETSPDDFEKEWDILDVWFDSGASHMAVLESDDRLSAPADLYLEGSDQHRGWFQSALLTSIGARDRAPFRAVLTHGFLLDGQGRAMSKSLGNVISPHDVIKERGADILRLWVCSSDYRVDIKVSKEILDQVTEGYRRIRNTLRYLISNLDDFTPEANAIPHEKLEEMDRWVLSVLAGVVERVDRAFETFEFHQVYHEINEFCTVTLSAVYFDVIKDRLYCSAPDDATRRAAQTVIYHLRDHLTRLLAPILVFTSDEVWEFSGAESQSVHLADFPTVPVKWIEKVLEEKWDRLLTLRREIAPHLEELRRQKKKSLDVEVTISPMDGLDREFLTENLALLKSLIIVSEVYLGQDAPGGVPGPDGRPVHKVEAAASASAVCGRCWMRLPSVGSHADHPALCDRCHDVVVRLDAKAG